MSKSTLGIKVCKDSDGRYVGLTFSDRWNLDTLRRTERLDINAVGFTSFRARVKEMGFTLSSAKAGVTPQWKKTVAEFAATVARPLAGRVAAVMARLSA